jgi:hypothetical protein
MATSVMATSVMTTAAMATTSTDVAATDGVLDGVLAGVLVVRTSNNTNVLERTRPDAVLGMRPGSGDVIWGCDQGFIKLVPHSKPHDMDAMMTQRGWGRRRVVTTVTGICDT